MSDFLLVGHKGLKNYLTKDFDLECANERYIVANQEGLGEIYTQEADLFINRSNASDQAKADGVKIIYEKEAILFDRGVESSHKIDYDPIQCRYSGSIAGVDSLCATVCPENVISKVGKRLEFEHDRCIGCGSCVAICPAGAIEYQEAGKSTLEEIYPLYENSTPLLIARKDFEQLDLILPSGVVPFTLNSVGGFSESDLIGLFMESGSQVVIYNPHINIGQQKAIDLINEISNRLFDKPAILLADNQDSLNHHLSNATFVVEARKSLSENYLHKREQFAARLKLLLGDGDGGVVAGENYPTYGEVIVDEATCTLCMGCVEVCSPKALLVSVSDGALMGDFSKCTQCGECVAICPENSMTMLSGGVVLNRSFFEQKRLASDSEFCCVECGKPFARAKSIGKIVSIMEPLFANDTAKLRTLRCCADCKPKVMIASALQHQQELV